MTVATIAQPPSSVTNQSLSAPWGAACDGHAETTGIALTDEKSPKVSDAENLSCQVDAEKMDYLGNFPE
ncbi:uncharacterized protein ACLA_099210 [Aspergillus clavatus NRRL 1]|uniref:Uncharacterized protein n=1 Tax=Aspergillus clavatus (strain ATCC 1007 / CBS 513.65 / DSM 816 / NCTC 3887 / NRRL 1 / QM 1276 / 107) TaxID=344612 RepID=A1CN40_ASPCL|nr:uncharacterized protein ACLA_099210 [Aspergillus clavatus NRRL 1]EAW08977.1 hypothetical protein ACLA_099210 [Aspergillus clavatus NRRL 1]